MIDQQATASEGSQVLREVMGGDRLALSAAAKLFPSHRGEGASDPSTVFRWVRDGSRLPDGRKLKLEAVRVGCRWITSKGAVERFVMALTGAANPEPLPASPPPRTTSERRRSSDAATRALIAAGA